MYAVRGRGRYSCIMPGPVACTRRRRAWLMLHRRPARGKTYTPNRYNQSALPQMLKKTGESGDRPEMQLEDSRVVEIPSGSSPSPRSIRSAVTC